MRKIVKSLILSSLCALCIGGFTACGGNENIQDNITDNGKSELISANGFTFDGKNGKLSVTNQTDTYSFINDIQVSEGASWNISFDTYGLETIPTKTILLNVGDNTVYLLITSSDGKNINLYTMTVRRRPIYTVTFNTDGGTAVASQQVEEGSFAIEPTTKKIGYIFNGWNYDFNNPITADIIIKAKFKISDTELNKYEYTNTNGTYILTGIKDKNVTEIILPDYFVAIENNAFKDCTSLTKITIPDSVTSVGENAFIGCKIESAKIPAIACYSIGYSNDKLKAVEITSGKIIEGRAFYGCTSLENIIIPDTVSIIGSRAFYGCKELVGIILPNDIIRIEDSVFSGCKKLTNIIIPENVTSIGRDAFRECSSLNSITIPKKVSSIGIQAFLDTALNSAVFKNPSGWQYTYEKYGGSKETVYFATGEIANSSTAASYLRKHYSVTWVIG